MRLFCGVGLIVCINVCQHVGHDVAGRRDAARAAVTHQRQKRGVSAGKNLKPRILVGRPSHVFDDAGAILHTRYHVPVTGPQTADQVMAYRHSRHRREVIKIEAQARIINPFNNFRIHSEQAVICNALIIERRQCQNTFAT